MSRTTEGWKFYPSREFKIHWGSLVDISNIPNALWRMLWKSLIILFSLAVPELLEKRNKLPFPQRLKYPLNLPAYVRVRVSLAQRPGTWVEEHVSRNTKVIPSCLCFRQPAPAQC